MNKNLKIAIGVGIGLSALTLSLGLGLGLGLQKSPSQQVYDIINSGEGESRANEYHNIQRQNKIVCTITINEDQVKSSQTFKAYYTPIYGHDKDSKGDKIFDSDYYSQKYRGIEIFRKKLTGAKVTSSLNSMSVLYICYNKVNNG